MEHEGIPRMGLNVMVHVLKLDESNHSVLLLLFRHERVTAGPASQVYEHRRGSEHCLTIRVRWSNPRWVQASTLWGGH